MRNVGNRASIDSQHYGLDVVQGLVRILSVGSSDNSRFNQNEPGRCISLIQQQISFNVGVWSLINVSFIDYEDLIESITAGRYWLQSTFNVTVTTGFLLGDYLYPSAVFEVLLRAGLKHIIIHHVGTHSPYYSSNPTYAQILREGGYLDESRKIDPIDPNCYEWKSGDNKTLRVNHSYETHSNVLNNLISIYCHATPSTFFPPTRFIS